jgi:acyl-CoA reductase-like NAD-dependent aldehyde dehydrogenase
MSTQPVVYSINPATEEVLATLPETTSLQVENTLSEVSHTCRRWCQTSMDEFLGRFVPAVGALCVGDPMDRTRQMGPLAREDIRVTLEQQVQQSISQKAVVLCGGSRAGERGYFFAPTVMTAPEPTVPVAGGYSHQSP